MKKIILIAGFLVMILNVNAQSSKDDLVRNLFSITKIDKMAPALIGTIINNFKKKDATITAAQWEDIKKSISYSKFNNKLEKIYIENYTLVEIRELINLYNSNDLDTYKEKSRKIESKLYQLGNEFGQEVAKTIVTKIQFYKS